ncbi:Crp/Fnr family transcriptional regulator [Reichenbachiella versicolor]|uniref:Crp/Fnr family transcriptional regulator n=1 Tax=Reichenbachiella versicolor TaxID=1821036 RepID=UPI000D6DE1F0|nr:Crp/Fnr family transcriptional regulator [Reichenbachiella versicolor]
MNKLIEYINTYTSFNEEEVEALRGTFTVKTFDKKEVIFRAGKVSNELYFVTKGCVRLFYIADGIDKTAFFYTEGQFICAGESYTYNVPAIESYEAVEPSEILVFSKAAIEKLTLKVPKMEIIARVAVENELITSQKVIASFVTKSPEERYIDLLEKQKQLFQRVPQQYIASFLGVSPETLSRIKARVHKKIRS